MAVGSGLRNPYTRRSGANRRSLPQPVDYLFTDAARCHGSVRARATRTCLTGAEAEIAEIAHTRGLTKLRLAQIAPTVLTSPLEVDVVVGVSVDGEVVDARIAVIVQHAHGTRGCRTVSKACRKGRRKCLRGGDPATAAAPGLLA